MSLTISEGKQKEGFAMGTDTQVPSANEGLVHRFYLNRVGVDFAKEKMGEHHETLGTAKLYIDDKEVASAAIRTQMRFSLCGEALCIDYDSGDAVSSLYKPRFDVTDGTIHKVVFDIASDKYIDVEKLLGAAMARE